MTFAEVTLQPLPEFHGFLISVLMSFGSFRSWSLEGRAGRVQHAERTFVAGASAWSSREQRGAGWGPSRSADFWSKHPKSDGCES